MLLRYLSSFMLWNIASMKNVTHPFHEWLTNHKNMGTYYTKNNNTLATEKDKYGKEGEWDTKEDGFMDESV